VTRKHIVLFVLLALTAFSAFGQEAEAATGGVRWGVIGAAFVLGIAAGIARNPSAAGPIRLAMIIGLALIESLVIYALIIAFMVHKL
jgi:F-type H+-transporting ATPase subunit c